MHNILCNYFVCLFFQEIYSDSNLVRTTLIAIDKDLEAQEKQNVELFSNPIVKKMMFILIGNSTPWSDTCHFCSYFYFSKQNLGFSDS